MSVGEAYLALGLTPAADRDQVHGTFRRLALQYHPDRNPGDASLERFKELAAAYRVLQRKFRVDDEGPDEVRDECERCGKYAVLRTALDGHRCCSACLSAGQRRLLLPAPPVVIVSCAVTIVLLVMAGAALLAGCFSGSGEYWAGSLVLGLVALVSLAITCLTVVYTAEPRRWRKRRLPTRNRRAPSQ